MIEEAQITVRNVGFLVGQRILYVAGGFLFAFVVPRLMGPDTYGRYALVASLSIWFVFLSDLGFTQVMGRYVPEFTFQRDREGLETFFNSLFTLSLVSSTLSACLYFFFTRFFLGDLNPFLLITMTGVVFVRGCSNPCFILFLGLNRAWRWGMRETARQFLSIFFLIPGFFLGGLAGAALGILLSEMVLLTAGLYWTRAYFSRRKMGLNLRYVSPYLRFGLIFFIFNLLTAAFQHGGEIQVRFFHGNYVQVGYFGLAYSVYLALAFSIPQLTLSFTPLLTTLHRKGEIQELKQWIELLLKWLGAGGVMVVFAVLLLGEDWIPTVLGEAYRPVATLLFPLSLALLLQALSSVGILLTLIYEQPIVALTASGFRLIAFWVVGIPLVIGSGSLGGCWAVLAASALYTAYLTWRMQAVIPYSLRTWAGVIGLGVLFLPLGWLRSSWWMVNLGMYGLFFLCYVGLLVYLRIIPAEEVKAVWKAMGSGTPTPDSKFPKS